MSYETDVEHFMVTYNGIASGADGEDADDLPDLVEVNGTIKFTANLRPQSGRVKYLDAAPPFELFPTARRAQVRNGRIEHEGNNYVKLEAATPNAIPADWTWQVEMNLATKDGTLSIPSFAIEGAPGSTVDLVVSSPASVASGVPTVAGPRGYSIRTVQAIGVNGLRFFLDDGAQTALPDVAIPSITAANEAAQAASGSAAAAAGSAQAASGSAAAAAGSATTATTEAGNASSSATAAGSSATAAAGSATAAGNAATAASSSATAAAGSATTASTQAGNASSSATAAAGSATTAAGSATESRGFRDEAEGFAAQAATGAPVGGWTEAALAAAVAAKLNGGHTHTGGQLTLTTTVDDGAGGVETVTLDGDELLSGMIIAYQDIVAVGDDVLTKAPLEHTHTGDQVTVPGNQIVSASELPINMTEAARGVGLDRGPGGVLVFTDVSTGDPVSSITALQYLVAMNTYNLENKIKMVSSLPPDPQTGTLYLIPKA